MKYQYNPWPLGKLPKLFQRPELDLLHKSGYVFNDPRDVIDIFEQKVAEYAGSYYAVAVDSCTNALFLCLQYVKNHSNYPFPNTITIPKQTYISVPQSINHSGYFVRFKNMHWIREYQLWPFDIYDAAVRFNKNMYIHNTFYCLSFQIKKILPIGKGGMILLNDKDAYKWFKKARYEGRDITKPYDKDELQFLGWNMYMTPEDAARGILLMDQLPIYNKDMGNWSNYPDISKQSVFK